jgi:hypothetical protein
LFFYAAEVERHKFWKTSASPNAVIASIEALALTGGGTGVRADATVRYAAPRLAAQRVPPQARVLEINVTGGPRDTGSLYRSLRRAGALLGVTLTSRGLIPAATR